MREAVDAFTKSRPDIIKFAKNPPVTESPRSPKRKAPGLQENETNKRSRMSTRSSKARAAELTTTMIREADDIIEINDTEDDEPGKASGLLSDCLYISDNARLDDGLVSCPICLARMKDWQVDRHLDTNCPGEPQPQKTPNPGAIPRSGGAANFDYGIRSAVSGPSNPSRPPERLPTLAYGMLKEPALRKKLAELGLSATGNRQMLERRHKEWIMLWNANCDSAHPKKRSELLQDLDTWERTIGTRAPASSRAINMGAQIKDKDFDGSAWAAKHDTSFKDLIANARKSRRQAEEKAEAAATETREEDEKVDEAKSAPRDPEPVPDQAAQPGPFTGAVISPPGGIITPSVLGQTYSELTQAAYLASSPAGSVAMRPEQHLSPMGYPVTAPQGGVFVGSLNELPNLGIGNTERPWPQ